MKVIYALPPRIIESAPILALYCSTTCSKVSASNLSVLNSINTGFTKEFSPLALLDNSQNCTVIIRPLRCSRFNHNSSTCFLVKPEPTLTVNKPQRV